MAEDKKDNLHQGHRARLKRQFQETGFDHFEDHNVLEFLLFYAIPRRDTNEIAHRLMEKFGSFPAVLEASLDDLCQVEGVGEHAAILLKTYLATARRYGDRNFQERKGLPTHKELGKALVEHFAGLEKEQVYAIFYDLSYRQCGTCVLHEGDINSVGFSVRNLGEAILKYKASYMVLAHNHPGGLPIASSDDLNTTDRICAFASHMGVLLMDHFIVAGGTYSGVQKETYLDLYYASKRRH